MSIAGEIDATGFEARGDLEGRILPGSEISKRLEDFLHEYLQGKSSATLGTYKRSLNAFKHWVALQQDQFRFSPGSVHAYKEYLEETRGLQGASVSTYLTALRRFCQYLVDIRLLDENPALRVKGSSRPTSHTRSVLTEQETRLLLDALRETTLPEERNRPPKERDHLPDERYHLPKKRDHLLEERDWLLRKRDQAMIYLMLYGGLSEVEIVRCDVQDLEYTLMGHYLHVQGKGRKEKDQQVPIDQRVLEKVRGYLSARGTVLPQSPLFVSHGYRSDGLRLHTRTVRSRVNHYLLLAGVKRAGISPHSLTHTAALIWLNEGMDIEEVRKRKRHGMLDTTLIYRRRQEEMRRGLERGERLPSEEEGWDGAVRQPAHRDPLDHRPEREPVQASQRRPRTEGVIESKLHHLDPEAGAETSQIEPVLRG